LAEELLVLMPQPANTNIKSVNKVHKIGHNDE
jgi:hypothetical protein